MTGATTFGSGFYPCADCQPDGFARPEDLVWKQAFHGIRSEYEGSMRGMLIANFLMVHSHDTEEYPLHESDPAQRITVCA